MNINNRWFLLLAVAVGAAAAAAGAAVASKSSRHHRTVRNSEHKSQLKSWENEGGNLAPTPVADVML